MGAMYLSFDDIDIKLCIMKTKMCNFDILVSDNIVYIIVYHQY